MLKKVLDAFAKEDIILCTDGQTRRARKLCSYLCPLQLTFGEYNYYKLAKLASMSEYEVNAIIYWADTGKWPKRGMHL